jgi:rod shape-determining protein MreC
MRRLNRRQRRAAIALAVVAVLFLTSDVIGASYSGARGGVQGVFGALYRGPDGALGAVRRWVQALPHLQSNSATIARLRAEVAELRRQQQVSDEQARTKAQLDRLQLQATRGGYRVLPARVIAIGASGSFDWTITVDAGSRDGVRLGQTVIAGPALVGRVVRVSATSATVLLAVDPGSGVGVRETRTGELGVVTGHGLQPYTFTALDPAFLPKAGDQLVSGPSGSTTYVPGLAVGTVIGAVRGPDAVARVSVRPAVSASALDLVGVVLLGTTSATAPSGSRPALAPGGTSRAGADGSR